MSARDRPARLPPSSRPAASRSPSRAAAACSAISPSRPRAGTVTAVLGPNGAGKTTLLDVCLGWRRPDRGTVLLAGGRSRRGAAGEQARTMSLVPQRENVRFDFSVTDYVLLGRSPHLPTLGAPGPADLAIAREALRTAGIAGLAERSIATLSGGEYQLMLIARSLAQQLDGCCCSTSPRASSIPRTAQRVTALLRRLADRGMTVVYTSHDPQAAAAAADTVHLLREGQVRLLGIAAADADRRGASRRLRCAVPRGVDPPRAARELGRLNARCPGRGGFSVEAARSRCARWQRDFQG